MKDRWIQILELASEGRTHEDIARELGVSRNTIACQALQMFQHLGADNMVQAVAMALRRKLIE